MFHHIFSAILPKHILTSLTYIIGETYQKRPTFVRCNTTLLLLHNFSNQPTWYELLTLWTKITFTAMHLSDCHSAQLNEFYSVSSTLEFSTKLFRPFSSPVNSGQERCTLPSWELNACYLSTPLIDLFLTPLDL